MTTCTIHTEELGEVMTVVLLTATENRYVLGTLGLRVEDNAVISSVLQTVGWQLCVTNNCWQLCIRIKLHYCRKFIVSIIFMCNIICYIVVYWLCIIFHNMHNYNRTISKTV